MRGSLKISFLNILYPSSNLILFSALTSNLPRHPVQIVNSLEENILFP